MKFYIGLLLCVASALAVPAVVPVIEPLNIEVPVQNLEGRITNGQSAVPGQLPYQVGLAMQIDSDKIGWCGGSIIGKEWILTAAHCVDDAQFITVFLGATERKSPSDVQVLPGKCAIVHPGWSKKTVQNDIALIKIKPLQFNRLIQPVKLPSLATTTVSFEKEIAISSGWGHFSDMVNSTAPYLQWAPFQVISNHLCARFFGSFVKSTNLCVLGQPLVSTCAGDSGGPLVTIKDKTLIGLTSFGTAKTCENNYPSVFTRISSYTDWIKTHTGISY